MVPYARVQRMLSQKLIDGFYPSTAPNVRNSFSKPSIALWKDSKGIISLPSTEPIKTIAAIQGGLHDERLANTLIYSINKVSNYSQAIKMLLAKIQAHGAFTAIRLLEY